MVLVMGWGEGGGVTGLLNLCSVNLTLYLCPNFKPNPLVGASTSSVAVCVTGGVCVCRVWTEWLSSYALGLTTPGLRVQTQH